jgi:hypothetical protein
VQETAPRTAVHDRDLFTRRVTPGRAPLRGRNGEFSGTVERASPLGVRRHGRVKEGPRPPHPSQAQGGARDGA